MSLSHAPFDVVVLSATPAGLAAAIAAARRGCSVALVERTAHIGGLPANGLGATDIQTRGATGGLFLEFVGRVRAHYAKTYGETSPQVQDCRDGYLFEPSVAERIFEDMLAETPRVTLLRQTRFDSSPANVRLQDGGPEAIRVTRIGGDPTWIEGRVFVDASYEGDLAAACGVEFRVGREAAAEYGEPMAGVVYAPWRGEPAPESTGAAHAAIQAYNYRLCLTRDPANRVPIPRPESYLREEYVSLIEDVLTGRWTGEPGRELELDGIGRVVNLVRLPNGKFDANNQHLAFLSTDLPEENVPWPTADWAWRDGFAARLRDYTLGLLWFCQNDLELPGEFRERCQLWGLAADEYRDNSNFPRQVYVREARRIVGRYLFTAHDSLPSADTGRARVHPDSVTASHYPLDSHATRKREAGKPHLEGFFNLMNVPYTVPYGVMVPRGVDALLVPVSASSTHVGYSTLRMEPCWMGLGQAAGTAAALARATGVAIGEVSIRALQDHLLEDDAVLVHLPETSPDPVQRRVAQKAALSLLVSEEEVVGTARAAVPEQSLDAVSGSTRLGPSPR